MRVADARIGKMRSLGGAAISFGFASNGNKRVIMQNQFLFDLKPLYVELSDI